MNLQRESNGKFVRSTELLLMDEYNVSEDEQQSDPYYNRIIA
jgi:hypothetical protein